VGRGQVY